MNTAEYVGKDGRTYRWLHDECADLNGYVHQVKLARGWTEEWIEPDDVTVAVATLESLRELEEYDDWVAWEYCGQKLRCKKDGSRAEYEKFPGCWHNHEGTAKAFAQGREIGLQRGLAQRQAETDCYNKLCDDYGALMRDYNDLFDALKRAKSLVQAMVDAVDNPHCDGGTQRAIRKLAKALSR